jgi:hypothetical protein
MAFDAARNVVVVFGGTWWNSATASLGDMRERTLLFA